MLSLSLPARSEQCDFSRFCSPMADDEAVKMATMKKAYAEIILNTSKEAAARILVADRKAACYEKELFTLKQEALRMLVQLKQMLDSKTTEAEVRSADQQRKIEELEAQLSEAEGIIVDLREELRLTQDKLEKVKYSQEQTLKRHTSEDYEDQQPPSKNELIAKTDHGRCQTIQYPSTEDVCSTKNPAEMASLYACGDRHIKSARAQPSTTFRPSILSHGNATLNTFDDVKSSKERSSSCSSECDEKDVKITSNGSEAKSLEYESHYVQALGDGFRRTRKNVKYREAIAALRRSSRGRRAKSCQPPSFAQCRTYSGKQNEASIEVPDKNGMCPTPGSYCVTSSYEVNPKHDTSHERSNEFSEKSKLGETEGNPAEKESDLSCEIDPLKFDTALADCNLHDIQISEESEGISNRADNDNFLKFTFQRKRKKEALTKLDSNIAPKANNVMGRDSLEQGDALKLQKSIVKDEQSKDSRQLLQVARQLISLAGNGRS